MRQKKDKIELHWQALNWKIIFRGNSWKLMKAFNVNEKYLMLKLDQLGFKISSDVHKSLMQELMFA